MSIYDPEYTCMRSLKQYPVVSLQIPPLEFQHFEITENDDQSEEKIIILQYAFSKTIKYCKIIYTKKSKSHF